MVRDNICLVVISSTFSLLFFLRGLQVTNTLGWPVLMNTLRLSVSFGKPDAFPVLILAKRHDRVMLQSVTFGFKHNDI